MSLDRLRSSLYISLISNRKLITKSLSLSSSKPRDRFSAILKNISKGGFGEVFYRVGGVRQGQQQLSNIYLML